MHHYLSKPLNEWIRLGPDRGAASLTLADHEVALSPEGVARARQGDTEFPWLIVAYFNEGPAAYNAPLVMCADTDTALDRVAFMRPKLQLKTLDGLQIVGSLLELPDHSHAANNKEFASFLNALAKSVNRDMDFMPAFATMLGYRALVNSYHNHFRQPFLPLSDGESALLAKSLILDDMNTTNARRIVDKYRGMYHLASHDSLDLIGTPR